MTAYRVMDEPRPGKLSQFAVDPMWPMLAFMLGGAVCSWLWSLFNSFAIDGPNRYRERALIAAAVVTYVLALGAVIILVESHVLLRSYTPYLMLGVTVVELIFCYALYLRQQEDFEIYKYFGGQLANPWAGLLLAWLLGGKIKGLVINMIIMVVFSAPA